MNQKHARFLVLILILALPTAAIAGNQPLGLVGGIVGMFADVLKSFNAAIHSSALKLGGVLLSAEVAYFWYQKFGSNEMDDWSSILMLLLKHLALVGFWFWAMNHSAEILQSIYNFFVGTGQAAAPNLDVDTLFGYGIELAQNIPIKADLGMTSFLTSPIVSLTTLVAELCLMIAFAVVAAQVLLAKIEFLFVITAAPIYMAFGVFKFSRDWATKTMSHAVATGTKILMIYMLAGAMVGLAHNWEIALQTANVFTNPNQLLEIIGASLILIMLAFFVPSIANALMSGNTSLSGSSAIMGAAAIGAAAVAGVAGAAQLAGGAKDLAGAAKDKALSGVGSIQDFFNNGPSSDGSIKNFLGGDPGSAKGAPGIGTTNESSRSASAGNESAPYVDPPGNASDASIGGANKPGNDKPRLRDHVSNAADKTQGLISHGQNLAGTFDDKTQVSGGNIRID